MAPSIKLLRRVLAYESGRAVLYATHLKVAIRQHALVVCPVSMAGEDATIHAVAYGGVGRPPKILTVPDPRFRDDQYDLFAALGIDIENYFMQRARAGDYPQVWVSSGAGAGLLSVLADRLRFSRGDARARRLGELLTYLTERYPVAEQQALQTATGALKLHFASGQDESEDEHLKALTTWIEPPPDLNVLIAVAENERVPMGTKTDPEFDNDHLAQPVSDYNEARRRGASPLELQFRAEFIHDKLAPVVTRIYDETQKAIAVLNGLGLPALPDLADMESREAESYFNFLDSLAAGHNTPLRDRPKRAAFGLAAREDAVRNMKAAVMLGDRVEAAQARLNGRIIVGQVLNPRRQKVAPWQYESLFEVRSKQRVLPVRVGDELTLTSDPRMCVEVVAVSRDGATVGVSLKIIRGQTAVGLPLAGALLEFVSEMPDWKWLRRERAHLKRRLAITPWTHLTGAMPAARPSSVPPPADPMAAVERLRRRR